MNKIYQRIDWENYPSSATPLNEDNLNKMDYAIDKLDDRIVTHETTKLDIATGNTLVKNVTFTERTGVFTIEKLNGSKFTINTALEKISINFYFDPTTQKLLLTLIDGTVQEIDLSALITQYEFLESDTITFEIDANGKVKANILNGSITGEKLEPNYLANVTLQANNAKTSADNAKTSEELAYQYAEEAKESASQTAKSDAKNITYDNTESGLSATNVKDALDEVAQGSVSAIAIDTTITDSTNAPLVRLKVKGKTEQFTTTGKNLCNSNDFTITAPDSGTAQSNYSYKSIDIHDKIVSNKTYIFSADVKILAGSPSEISIVFMNEALSTGTEIKTGTITNNHVEISISIGNASVYYYLLVYAGKQGSTAGNSIEFSNVMLRESTTDSTYEPYTGGIASPNTDYPQEINGLAKDGAIEVKTYGKNLCDNNNFTITAGTGTAQSNYVFRKINIEGKLKAYKTYTITADVKILAGSPTGISILFFDEGLINGTEVKTGAITNNHVEVSVKFGSNASKFYYLLIYAGVQGSTAGNSIEFSNVMLRESTTDATYEPYTETTAAIPTDAPLYEGDYLEIFADGSGVLHRKMAKVVFDGSSDENWNMLGEDTSRRFAMTAFANYKDKKNTVRSSHFVKSNVYSWAGMPDCSCLNADNALGFKYLSLTTLAEYKAWLQSNPVTVVYELAEPTETPLTAKQVAQFKKLYTFEPITNVLCDGEVEIQYYKNTPSGVAVGTVHKMANDEKATYDGDGNVITETYAKKTSIKVDDVLSETSTNPVQNKVITEALIKHNHKQKKIIVVTDSYGVPVREDDGTYGSWVDMLAEKYEVLKIASGGAGFVSYFDNKFLNNLRATTIDDKEAYTDIIVAGGVNDAGDSTKPITAEDISNGIIEFCDYCKTTFPNARVHIACVGGITPRSNLKERCLNLHNVVFQAYANTNADYDYCTFSESIFFDRSLLINVHPTEEGHKETYRYFNRMLNGQCSFTKNFNSVVTLNSGTQVGFHGTISNGVARYTGQRIQFILGEIEIGPAFNFATGVEVGTIDNNGVLAVPSRSGYTPYVIMGSLYVVRSQPSSLAYAGVGFLYPNEDGTKLLLQITSPDLVGGASDKIKANFYFIPTPTVIAQTTS